MIWTHRMKDIAYNATFVVEGAPETETYEGKALNGCQSQPVLS